MWGSILRAFVVRQAPTRSFLSSGCVQYSNQRMAVPLRSKKPKSSKPTTQYFVDSRHVRTVGGNGGDGCVSFLRLWCNENAGPDGGDGGNGGHVILQATQDVKDFNHITALLRADDGAKGATKDCHGKNANHTVVKVPIGTIVKSTLGKVVGDLDAEGMMFVAARGGAGGKGNQFFKSDLEQAPQVAEFGATGEETAYTLELRSMAHVGFIGLPNAGKSTLLRAISRARPKVAPYPFTTLKPHLGMVQYDDYEQIAVADLPGLIEGSHKNKGLGIQFLKHAERCNALLFVIDASTDEPWTHYHTLLHELGMFSEELTMRPRIIIANKIDLPEAENNVELLAHHVDVPVLPVSAKIGTNIAEMLQEIRIIYESSREHESPNNTNEEEQKR
ncbi:mitochondrial ribosome-associated GTPase 2 [Anopheles ziemanni]|uniref:mitochondrial ribosome-associated GTPase 2 n=1 Tax=Anopheles coustani TaxID=139045 RepID=UPI002657B8A6|nr:mitochondrial ribosome-associated GTPase 2 [Anopheles coustani]XP_058177395.1 mitochondrial ribosome-associated GTPase 2 [Anopheles ziemanni]